MNDGSGEATIGTPVDRLSAALLALAKTKPLWTLEVHMQSLWVVDLLIERR